MIRSLNCLRFCFSGLIKSKKHVTLGEDYLRSLIRWMSNCVQIILYLRGQSSKARAGGRGRLDDDTQGAFHELASGLEEIVVFCFQQTVYTITKVRKRCNCIVTTVYKVFFAREIFALLLHLQTVSSRRIDRYWNSPADN